MVGMVFFPPGPRRDSTRTSDECYTTRLSTNWNWKFGVDNSVEESRGIFGLYNQVCIPLPFHCRGQNELRKRHDFVGLNPLHLDCCFVFAYLPPCSVSPTHILCYVCFIGFYIWLKPKIACQQRNKSKKEQPSGNLDSSEFILNFSWSILEFSKVNRKKFSLEPHGDPENLHSSCIAANFQ